MNRWKAIGYSFGTAVAASLGIVFLGLLVLGFQFTELQGRIVGALGTAAGIAGALLGLKAAARSCAGK